MCGRDGRHGFESPSCDRLVDELPELAGIEPLYGVSVHHCLYCDGFEYAGKPVAAYGKGDKGAELAVMMKHWMSDVVASTRRTDALPVRDRNNCS